MLTLSHFIDGSACPYTVRTPRRRGGFAAQVWGDGGFWLVGTFPTKLKAREAALEFLDTAPVEPADGTPRRALPSNWFRRRQWVIAPEDAPKKYVRRVKAGSWQARFWLGTPGGSLNLGLWSRLEHGADAEWCAAQVSKAFAREWRPGRTVAEVVEQLKRSPRLSERVPMHVEVPVWQRDLVPQSTRRRGVGVRTPRPATVERARRPVTLANWFQAA